MVDKERTKRSGAHKQTSAQTNRTVIKIVVAALSVFLLLLIIALIINLVKLGAVNSRKKALENQNAQLAQIIEKNDGMIDYCASSEFVENYAREMLDMVYRGEIVVDSE